MPELMSPKEAGLHLGISPSMLKEWRLRGEGPAYVPLTPRKIRYRPADLDAWIASQVVEPAGKAVPSRARVTRG